MLSPDKNKISTLFLGLLVPLFLLIAMELVGTSEFLPSQIIVPPHRIFAMLVDLLSTGELLTHLRYSIVRVLGGFAIGSGTGFVLGVLMALFPRIERVLAPLLIALNQVPIFGWVPFLMILFGIEEQFKIVFISLAAFFPMLLNTFEGIHGVPRTYLEVARTFEFNHVKLMRKVLFPAALPSIFTGIKLSLGISWMSVIGAELIASSEGIGYLIVWGRQLFQMDIVYVGIITVGTTGYVMYKGLEALEGSLMKWHRKNS
ncbi:MAG: ABC transporter permease [Chlorobiaceae bacterium]|nr:ABC transporter permease [Chlorobiaceae bacterium]